MVGREGENREMHQQSSWSCSFKGGSETRKAHTAVKSTRNLYTKTTSAKRYCIINIKHIATNQSVSLSLYFAFSPAVLPVTIFIPEYINFFTSDYEKYYLCEGTACLDERLHWIMQDMRELNISEAEQLRFAYAWFRGIESQGKISLALMPLYLSGRFRYRWNTPKESTDLLLPECLFL